MIIAQQIFEDKDRLKRHWLSKSGEEGHPEYEWEYEEGESEGTGRKKKKPKKTPVESPPKLIEVKEEVESSEEEEDGESFECRKCGQRFETKGKNVNCRVLKKFHEGSCKGRK